MLGDYRPSEPPQEKREGLAGTRPETGVYTPNDRCEAKLRPEERFRL